MEEHVAKLIEKKLYEYVKTNYGENEADDPSWNIEDIASELAKGTLKYDIYRAVERDYLRQDCDMVAEQNDIALTEEERELVVDEYMDCDTYVDAHAEDWLYFMNRVKGE